MSNGRQSYRIKKKEQLPSFLRDLTTPPEDFSLYPKAKPSLKYLGPIFFGKCSGYPHHAPPHSLKLGSFHQPQHGMLHGNDSLSKLLLPKASVKEEVRVVKTFRPKIKRQKIYHDTYPHVSPGRQKMFPIDVTPHVVDLGKSESVIEGEATIEMPFCRVSSRSYKRKSVSRPEVDFTLFSDIREKNRKYMSYKERIAHAHFPKEFTTVRIIGPTIPASITITKLPSKRKTQSELTLELKAKAERETEEEKDKVQEIEPSLTPSEEQPEESEILEEEENVEEEIEGGSSQSMIEEGEFYEQEEEEEGEREREGYREEEEESAAEGEIEEYEMEGEIEGGIEEEGEMEENEIGEGESEKVQKEIGSEEVSQKEQDQKDDGEKGSLTDSQKKERENIEEAREEEEMDAIQENAESEENEENEESEENEENAENAENEENAENDENEENEESDMLETEEENI